MLCGMRKRSPSFGHVRENWIEHKLRRALDEGDVTDLPGAGQPIPGIDGAYDPLWWGKKVVKRERLDFVPPAVEIRRTVDRTLAEVAELRDERQVRRRLEALNCEIAKANATTTFGPATSVALFDVEKLVERWRRRSG